MRPWGLGPDGSSGQAARTSPNNSPLGPCVGFGVTSAMSLRDQGGEEECFESDCGDEERKFSPEQHDILDLVEEGKFCPLNQPGPFPVQIGLAVPLIASTFFIVLISCNVKCNGSYRGAWL